MNARKIFAVMLCAAMLWAAGAFAQRSNPCDRRYHFITPSNCTSVAEQTGKNLAKAQQAVGEASAAIALARRRFWETYPDKPGAVAAQDEFGQLLYGKDIYYLVLALPEATQPGGFKGKDFFELVAGKMDGGIPRYSSLEFTDWVEEIAKNLGDKPYAGFHPLTNQSTLPDNFVKAMAASE
ncbi:MAG: hypothetical protein ABJB49_07040, partial [Nitrospirota bacterium]